MAGDWIKMRGALIKSPKLIRVSREIHKNKDFREWLTPGGSYVDNDQILSDEALRCVTFSLLGVTWSYAREHGKWRNDDLLLQYITVDDIDGIAGVSGFGKAMQTVGWLSKSEDEDGVLFNNFKEFNVPMTPAEKQKEYRIRQKERNQTVTETCNKNKESVTPREEKRRINKNKSAVKEIDAQIAAHIFSQLQQDNPNHKRPNMETWASDIRKMRELDKRKPDDIVRVFNWANKDDFWKANILSPAKLRQKFDQLVAKMNSKRPAQTGDIYARA